MLERSQLVLSHRHLQLRRIGASLGSGSNPEKSPRETRSLLMQLFPWYVIIEVGLLRHFGPASPTSFELRRPNSNKDPVFERHVSLGTKAPLSASIPVTTMSSATAVDGPEAAHVESPTRISFEAPASAVRLDLAILDPPSNTSVYLSWPNWIPALSLPRAIWIGNTCAILQAFWKNKGAYLDRSIVVLTLFLACFALWPSFSGAEDTKKATELAKWTAIKDFIEFCESVSSRTFWGKLVTRLMASSIIPNLKAVTRPNFSSFPLLYYAGSQPRPVRADWNCWSFSSLYPYLSALSF